LTQRGTGFNRPVLTLIAHENKPFDASLLGDIQQLIDWPSGQQTGFIDDPKLWAGFAGQLVSNEARYRQGFQSSLIQGFDAARGHAEPVNRIALSFGEFPYRSHRGGLGGTG
jgi:hypothetical protein